MFHAHERPLFALTSTLLALLLATVATAHTPAGSVCVADTCYSAINQHPIDFNGSVTSCRNRGGDLASIADQAENDLVWVTVDFCQNSQRGWAEGLIGLNDIASEGNFVWSDGEPYTYSDPWAHSQPDDLNNQDWVELRGSDANGAGKWDDTRPGQGGTPRCYICEFDIVWEPSSGGLSNLPANAFAYDEGYICQSVIPSSVNGHIVPGRVTDQGCAPSNQDTWTLSQNYWVLTTVGGTASYSWQPWTGTAPTNAVVGGSTNSGHRYVCRIPGVGAGTTNAGYACRVRKFPVGTGIETVSSATGYEILVFDP